MSQFPLSEVDLDDELFRWRNPAQAVLVILNRLAYNDLAYRTKILEQIKPEMLITDVFRFIFRNMVDMIHNQGQVDIQQIQKRIPDFSPGQADFIAGNLANLELALSFNPTSEQVDRALEILITRPIDWNALRKWSSDWKTMRGDAQSKTD